VPVYVVTREYWEGAHVLAVFNDLALAEAFRAQHEPAALKAGRWIGIQTFVLNAPPATANP
jgi:hypothetical protein